jgi:hypothetical protein
MQWMPQEVLVFSEAGKPIEAKYKLQTKRKRQC